VKALGDALPGAQRIKKHSTHARTDPYLKRSREAERAHITHLPPMLTRARETYSGMFKGRDQCRLSLYFMSVKKLISTKDGFLAGSSLIHGNK
jgi:hypothetical protein